MVSPIAHDTTLSPGTSSTTSSTSASTASIATAGGLGKQDFLKLLIAQLKNQDPMKPMDDTQFVTQLAQFSALESMQSLQQEMGSVHQDQDFMKATLLIGKQVKATGADGTDLAGAVSEVHLVGGKVQVVIDGKTTDLSQVTSVTSATTSA